MTGDHTKPSADRMLATLIANHGRFLDFLTARVGDRDVAEEIIQEAFVRSIQKADDIRDEESVIAWFYRVLRNAVIDHYRRAATARKAMEARARETLADDAAFNAELNRTVCECVNDLIPLLKPEYAAIVRLVDLGETEISSAADALGITPGNARVRLHRARSALRTKLELSCGTCATHGCLDCTCSHNTRTSLE